MIPRYTLPEMDSVWNAQNKYRIWLMIEAYACEGMFLHGQIPEATSKKLWKKFHELEGKFDLKKIEKLDQLLKHDVLAFLTYIGEDMGEDSRFIHKGMTSSDVLDTCFNLQLMESAKLIEAKLATLLNNIEKKAQEYKYAECIGRTHGVHAEPITYGIKFASFYEEFKRGLKRLRLANQEIGTCAISGTVGVFNSIDSEIEKYVAKKLSERFDVKVECEPISTQIIPRDRHAVFFCTLAIIASSIERCAVNLRLLQMTEILEIEEPFSKGQKGSSAMPHKKNPILSENLTGLSRLIRMAVIPALEDVAIWHERDISHSSVERVIGPDSTILLDYALDRLSYIFQNLKVKQENSKTNMTKSKHLWSSHKILLALIEKDMKREEAYTVVQESAMRVWAEGIDMLDAISQDSRNILDMDQLLKIAESSKLKKDQIDLVFQRVFCEEKS